MRKELFKKIKLPEGIESEIIGNVLIIKHDGEKNEKKFDLSGITMKKEGDEIVVGNKKSTKKEKRQMNTIAAHIKNMIQGVKEKFEYKLKICFSHFPITVEVKGHEALIKNFLGEKTPRKVKIPQGAEVKVEKDIIKVSSSNKETAGQAAANFENVTRIPNRDRRIFQDGIFITNKCGEEI